MPSVAWRLLSGRGDLPMNSTGICLAAALMLAAGVASAQSHDDRYGPAPYGDYSHRSDAYHDREPLPGSDRHAQQERYGQGHYEWARVVRVDPVFDGRSRPAYGRRECETRRDGYASRDPRDHGYGDAYRGGDRHDPYERSHRDDGGRLVATVLGGIAGAVLGSRIGDGSGQVIGTAVGSMVGGAAGRGIYDANRRARDGYVTVCDPEPWRDGHRGRDAYGADPHDRAVLAYDVTWEYAGREYVTRTDHRPGDRIRVRVDVRAE